MAEVPKNTSDMTCRTKGPASAQSEEAAIHSGPAGKLWGLVGGQLRHLGLITWSTIGQSCADEARLWPYCAAHEWHWLQPLYTAHRLLGVQLLLLEAPTHSLRTASKCISPVFYSLTAG